MDFLFELLTPYGITENTFQNMLIAAILGISIYITLYAGLFSLANAGFMATGAYVSVILTTRYEWDFLLALIAGIIAAGLVSAIISVPVLRLSDIYLAIATIGFGEILVVLLRNFDRIYELIVGEEEKITGGATGIKGIPVITTTEYLLLYLGIVVFLMVRLHRSRFGRALVAIRQDSKVAANMGINVVYYQNMAFILGAMIAGGAGALHGHLNRIILPESYGFDRAVDILTFAVLGGTTTILGPIIGGFIIEYLPEILRRTDLVGLLGDIFDTDLSRYQANVRDMTVGMILLGVIVFLPEGIASPKLWRRVVGRVKNLLQPPPEVRDDA
jgi:branched-chain amino acid transport system permease protein